LIGDRNGWSPVEVVIMNVLVAYASKHGSTREIAEEIAGELAAQNLDVDVREIGEAPDLGRYDAAVLGSAIYMGRFLSEMRRFTEAHRSELQSKPVWLFSSGPIGDPPAPAGDPSDLTSIAGEIGAAGFRSFAGRLDHAELGLKDRLIVKAVKAETGDFRPWDDIRAWAGKIGVSLLSPAPA
jgi:menaquinone-dependent protoporphyrinogen oxidase